MIFKTARVAPATLILHQTFLCLARNPWFQALDEFCGVIKLNQDAQQSDYTEDNLVYSTLLLGHTGGNMFPKPRRVLNSAAPVRVRELKTFLQDSALRNPFDSSWTSWSRGRNPAQFFDVLRTTCTHHEQNSFDLFFVAESQNKARTVFMSLTTQKNFRHWANKPVLDSEVFRRGRQKWLPIVPCHDFAVKHHFWTGSGEK